MSQSQVNRPKRAHMFYLKLGLVVLVLIFALTIGLNIFKDIGIGKYMASLPEPTNPVTAYTVQPKEWTPVIETTGIVRPNQGAMLSAQTSGTIKSISVKSGQAVKKGDVLVEFDSEAELASLRASEAQLTAVRSTYQRYTNLLKSQSISQTEMDNAKAAYDQLTATIHSLKANLERRKIVAPFDGVSGIVQVNVGQYVTMGTEIVRVEDISTMRVDFSVSQTELENLKIGQKVTATADARSGETFAARVTAIEPAVNKATGLIDLQATFDPEDGKKLLSGMFTRLRLALPTEANQIVVPQVAISYNMYGESTYVLTALSQEDKDKLLNNDLFPHRESIDKVYRAKQITVFTKSRQGIYSQLKGNEVKAGDMLITGGQQRLSNGSLVIVTDKEGVGTTQPASKTNL